MLTTNYEPTEVRGHHLGAHIYIQIRFLAPYYTVRTTYKLLQHVPANTCNYFFFLNRAL